MLNQWAKSCWANKICQQCANGWHMVRWLLLL